jgi:hypothetical protein
MALTFPLPFLTCREICIVAFVAAHNFYYVHELNRYQMKCSILKHTTELATSIWEYVTCSGNNNRRVLRMHRELNSSVNRQNWMYDLGADDEVGNAVDGHGGKPTTEPLLAENDKCANNFPSIGGQRGKEIDPSPLSSRSGDPTSSESTVSGFTHPRWLISHGDGKQLTVFWHAAVTFMLWFVVTSAAINGPSMIDVLHHVGAFTGAMIAFVLPALLSFKLKGYSHLSLMILGIGGLAGIIGTIHSLQCCDR